jgi:hypothetical protein
VTEINCWSRHVEHLIIYILLGSQSNRKSKVGLLKMLFENLLPCRFSLLILHTIIMNQKHFYFKNKLLFYFDYTLFKSSNNNKLSMLQKIAYNYDIIMIYCQEVLCFFHFFFLHYLFMVLDRYMILCSIHHTDNIGIYKYYIFKLTIKLMMRWIYKNLFEFKVELSLNLILILFFKNLI